jgi:hypothetical protein
VKTGLRLDQLKGIEMRSNMRTLVVAVLLVSGMATLAQWRGGWSRVTRESARTAREIPQHGMETPQWTNAPGFERDVFTFTRVRYGRGGRDGRWHVDLPDAELNLSWRLQQITSMKVDPDGRIVNLTDPDLADYPFLYIVEPGWLWLSDAEIRALRNHLLNGGFLMLDDFWGQREWQNCEEVMRQVLPEWSFVELPLDHPLYSCLFRITSKGQVPNVEMGIQSQWTGITWEREDAKVVHHRAIFDDRGRMLVIAFHNTDNGDGWEWDGSDNYYFRNFSEKIAYPLAINTLFYVMTH